MTDVYGFCHFHFTRSESGADNEGSNRMLPETAIILSSVQVEPLQSARHNNQITASVSPDLGLSTVEVELLADEVRFPNGESVNWSQLEAILTTMNACYLVRDGEIEKVQRFSEDTGRFCSLMPTQGAPTLLLAGFPMHRIKGTDPHRDTLSKIKAVAPVVGRVLDTTTGLGYTAIEASRTADEVITVEIDPAVLEIAKLNPWSRELFDNPKISQLVGDSAEVVEEFHDASFSRVIH
ncbi:MAG TPA: hypothetical protein VKT25_13765, partial [Ktedonobacteraceae bacterium]|nr:hypothetical protein [Ktedonobacteraceae bacterium]